MTTNDRTERSESRRPFQNRLLYWLAIAMAPEAAMFPIESGRAMEQRSQLIRTTAAANQDANGDDREAA